MQPATADVSAMLRERRDHILLDWEAAAGTLPTAEPLPIPRLREDLRDVLVDLEAALRDRAEAWQRIRELGERHARLRMQQGFDLVTVTSALTLLRDCALHVNGEAGRRSAGRDRALDRAFDGLLVAVVAAYGQVQTRVLRALDHVASVSLESSSLDELLGQLAAALVEELPSVDSAAIYLLEDGEVRLRAQMGEEDGRTLYAVPMLRGSTLLGIARVGSTRAEMLSRRDRELFDSMVSRATSTIHQHLFREAAERRAEALAASEARLFRVEGRLRLAMEVAEIEAWDWDLRTGEVQCSERGRAMLGLPPDAPLHARRLLELLPVEDRRAHVRAWRAATDPEGDGHLARDLRIVRPSDGRERWLSVRARLWFDAAGATTSVLGTMLDITEQKQVEERMRILAEATSLLASSLDHRATLEQLAAALVPRLADGCAVDVLQPDGTLGDYVAVAHGDPAKVRALRTVRRRMLPSQMDASRGTMHVIRTGRTERVERIDPRFYEAITRDPEQLEALRRLELESLLIVPIGRAGRTLGALSLAHAGSGRRFGPEDAEFAQQIADRIAIAIDNAQLHEETRHAAELRQRLISVLSHDLRTPLTAIHLASALLTDSLQERPDDERQAHIIQRNAGRIRRLIDDLLDLSNIQAGRLELELRACRLDELMRRVVVAARPRAREAGVELVTRLDDLGDTAIRCDRARLRDALGRLVGFAREVVDERRTITVESTVTPERVDLVIRGAQIDRDADPEALFELYWQAKSAQERARGLGLFIARGVVEAHGGRLWVERRPDEAPHLVVSLPVDERG